MSGHFIFPSATPAAAAPGGSQADRTVGRLLAMLRSSPPPTPWPLAASAAPAGRPHGLHPRS